MPEIVADPLSPTRHRLLSGPGSRNINHLGLISFSLARVSLAAASAADGGLRSVH